MKNPLGLKLMSQLPARISRGALAKVVFEGFEGEFDYAQDERNVEYLCQKYGIGRNKLISECVTAYPSRGEYRYGVVVNMITGEIYQ